jgi:hypothetical protein
MERARGTVASVKGYSLSDDDIRKILGPDIKIITYPMLGEMSSIDQAFDSKGRCVMLVPNVSPTMGHWVAMIKRKNGIEFFDPYGDAPEEQKDGLSQSKLQALDIDHPFLTKLLRASGKPIYYNTKGFQSENRNVATCGRHAIARLLYAPYSIDKYDACIRASGLSPDDFVAGLTYNALKK